MALGYSILAEIHQNFIPGRGTEAQDIAGNLAGVILAAAFLILWQRLKPGFPISNGEELSRTGKKHRRRASIGRWQLTSQEAPNG